MLLARVRTSAAAALVAAVAATALTGVGTTASTASGTMPGITQAVDGVRIIVTGAGASIQAATRAAIESLGGTFVADLPLIGGIVADVPAGAVTAVAELPGVSAVTVDEEVTLEATGDASAPLDETAVETLGADKVWDHGVDGSGVGIAVIDTGVSRIDDLAGRVVGGVDLTPEANGVDSYGHGTPIAWLAAGDGSASGGRWSGVAPGAHIVPVKIAAADGSTELARLLVGLDWVSRFADTYDIRVVNLSLGSTPFTVDLVDAAVQRLWDQGLVVVVAAGNAGPGNMGTPARNTHVITVGASQAQGTKNTADDVLAPWSSTGVDADGLSKPDVVAPGQSLVVAGAPGSWGYTAHPEGHLGDGYQRVSGTSFSTGLISGAAALALDAHPEWTNDQVLGQLFDGARSVAGSTAPTPWLPRALRTDEPFAANEGAAVGNLGATAANAGRLNALGPIAPASLAQVVGSLDRAVLLGSGWYGSGWYGSGWYQSEWFGSGWYGSGWYGSGWYGSGWYGSGWYGSGWYGSGWYGSGWYGSGWYGSGWYGSGWYGSGWA